MEITKDFQNLGIAPGQNQDLKSSRLLDEYKLIKSYVTDVVGKLYELTEPEQPQRLLQGLGNLMTSVEAIMASQIVTTCANRQDEDSWSKMKMKIRGFIAKILNEVSTISLSMFFHASLSFL